MKFKDKLNELRKDKKISKSKLAKALGISRSIVAKWESGVAMPDDKQLGIIANYFGIDKNELIFKTEESALVNAKSERSNTKKKVIKILVPCIAALIVIVSVLAGLHFPRSISSFIDEDINELEKCEIRNLNDTYLVDSKNFEIVDKVFNTKVIPTFSNKYKTTSTYEIVLYFEECTYYINIKSIRKDEKVHFFYDKDYRLSKIVDEFIKNV